jgi:hypothetical protein
MGIREDVPKMLLSEVFLTNDSRNIHDELGEFRKLKGRIPLLYDAAGVKIQTPKVIHAIVAAFTASKKFVVSDGLAYAITGVTQNIKTFTIAGDHKAAIDAAIAVSATMEIYNSTGNDAAYTFVSATKNGSNTDIIVSEDIATDDVDGTIYIGSVPCKTEIEAVLVNNTFRVNGSTGNDKLYTVDSVTDVGGSTEIVSVEDVADATGDGNIFVGATPVICYHTYIKETTQSDYLFLGTAYHVWLWNDVNRTLTVKFTSATPTSVVDMTILTHLDNVYMTNNVDKIQWLDCTTMSNSFEVLDTSSGVLVGGAVYITKARYLGSYDSYLFIGFPTLSTGSVFPQRAYWSGRGTSGSGIDFDMLADASVRSDTGYKDFNREPSALVGFGVKGTDLIVAKGNRMVRGWLVTEDTVFEWAEEAVKVGCIAGKTIVNDRAGRLYWFASDLTLRELDTPDPISMAIDNVIRNINPEAAEYSQATYVDEYQSIFFAIPTQDSDTNNLVIEFNTITTKIYLHNIPVRAFAGYRRQVIFGYDTLPYATYEEWGIAWLLYDTKVNVVGYPLDLGSDYLGNTFVLHAGDKDDGAAWTGTLVFSTTLTEGKSPYIYKRVPNGMDIAFNRQASGTIAVRVKKDTKAWVSVGSVNLTGDGDATEDICISHLPFDKRARVFYFELSSSGQFEFLGAVFRELYYDGDR